MWYLIDICNVQNLIGKNVSTFLFLVYLLPACLNFKKIGFLCYKSLFFFNFMLNLLLYYLKMLLFWKCYATSYLRTKLFNHSKALSTRKNIMAATITKKSEQTAYISFISPKILSCEVNIIIPCEASISLYLASR